MQFFETDTVKVVSSKINTLKFSHPDHCEEILKYKMMLKKKIGIVIECDISNIKKERSYFVQFQNFDLEKHQLWFLESELALI